jgi:hypothetical protein
MRLRSKCESESGQQLTCQWTPIDGVRVGGRATSSHVWICQYPYPTMRSEGPGPDCAGCPIWEARHRDDSNDDALVPVLAGVR